MDPTNKYPIPTTMSNAQIRAQRHHQTLINQDKINAMIRGRRGGTRRKCRR